MFTDVLKQLPLTDGIASELFTNINADSYEGDVSFRATLRMLLYEKLQPYQSIDVKLSINNYKNANRKDYALNSDNGTTFFQPYPMPENTLFIIVLKGYSIDEFEQARANAKPFLAPFFFQEQPSLFLTQSGCQSYVFINEATKQTLVYMLNLTMKSWHKMQSAIPKLLPWFFPERIVEADRVLLRALTLKNSSTYLNIISEYAKKFNFHEDRLRRMLKDFGLSYEKQRLSVLIKDRSTNNILFNKLQDNIKECISKDREYQTAISGIESLLLQGDDTGLADYFICNKSLRLIAVENDSLSYVITTHLDYFDHKVFEKFMNNPKSYFFQTMSGLATDEAAYKKLLYALYGDEAQLRLRVCAEYRLSLSGTLEPVHHSERLMNYDDWLPHPHVDGARCLGSNRSYINELMLKKNT